MSCQGSRDIKTSPTVKKVSGDNNQDRPGIVTRYRPGAAHAPETHHTRPRDCRHQPFVLRRGAEAAFSNGVERTYERLVGKGAGYGAVMIVAMLDADHAVLVEEYCGGTDAYELSLPKGLIEPGEDVLAAAERELKEEAGYGARQLEHLTELSVVTWLHEPENPGGVGH